jgi:hypothetical protein
MSASNIDDFLQQDDAVEQLNDWQVKDVWCRMQLAHRAVRAYDYDDVEKMESGLQNYHSGYLIEVAIRTFGKDSRTVSALSWEDDPRNIERLFEEWTQEPDSDEASKVDVARSKIKTTLRGSGMARMKVARGRVEYHTGE